MLGTQTNSAIEVFSTRDKKRLQKKLIKMFGQGYAREIASRTSFSAEYIRAWFRDGDRVHLKIQATAIGLLKEVSTINATHKKILK
jgi:hypothetical protein